MKKALKARRRYLVATARADVAEGGTGITDMSMEAAGDDAWGDDDDGFTSAPAPAAGAGAGARAAATAATAAASSGGARAGAGAAAAKAPAPAPAPTPAAGGAGADAGASREDGWGDDDSDGPGGASEEESGVVGSIVSGARHDEIGPLPHGWTVQMDEEGDKWYYNEITQATSCEWRDPPTSARQSPLMWSRSLPPPHLLPSQGCGPTRMARCRLPIDALAAG